MQEGNLPTLLLLAGAVWLLGLAAAAASPFPGREPPPDGARAIELPDGTHASEDPHSGLAIGLPALLGAGGGWWDLAWRRRARVTFDNSASGLDLLGFPALIRLDPTSFDYSTTQDLGQDIRFVDAGGVIPLAYEIERWDEAGTSEIWVRVPRIDAGSTTDHVWIYYDNPAAPDGQAAQAVWSTGYVGVWHLNEAPPTGGTFADSTANPAHGSFFDPDSSADAGAPGVIAGGVELSGLDDYIDIGTPSPGKFPYGSAERTICAWGSSDTIFGYRWLVAWGALGPTDASTLGALNQALVGGSTGKGELAFPDLWDDADWHHVCFSYAGSLLTLFADGQEVVSEPRPFDTLEGFTARIGKQVEPAAEYWEGRIDEVRISEVARPGDWVRAQYLSQAGLLATLSAEESSPDLDADGVPNASDNCPTVSNPAQTDTDLDGAGDACDADDDDDGVPDALDCAPLEASFFDLPGDLGDTVRLSGSTISWDAEPDAEVYNVYRGGRSPGADFVYDHGCLFADSPVPSVEDFTLPSSGALGYYLVGKRNCFGDGPLGTDSADVPRPGGGPCVDGDGDGWHDGVDNCPIVANPSQTDTDGDSLGDACDDDDDDDGLTDDEEATLGTNPLDPDSDDDGLLDGEEVGTWGSNPLSAHSDGDGLPDGADNCPTVDNPAQSNPDGDLFGDVCDNCPAVANTNQANMDGDGRGDACDARLARPGLDGGGVAAAGNLIRIRVVSIAEPAVGWAQGASAVLESGWGAPP